VAGGGGRAEAALRGQTTSRVAGTIPAQRLSVRSSCKPGSGRRWQSLRFWRQEPGLGQLLEGEGAWNVADTKQAMALIERSSPRQRDHE